MKSWNKNSIYFRWFLISVFTTLCCVVFGGFTAHQLNKAEKLRDIEEHKRRMSEMKGPEVAYFKILKGLFDSGRFTVDEAYVIIRNSHENHPFIHSYLVDQNGAVLNSSAGAPVMDEGLIPHKISNDRSIVFAPKMNRPPPPDHISKKTRKEALLTAIVAMGVSIIVGLGLSVLFMSIYMRRRSREAELIIGKLKSGDLKARFDIQKNDETNELMTQFNEMADQIESLVENLRHTESTRTKLLQELAHDLRTPVASLKNLQETLLEKGHLLSEEKRIHVQNLSIKEIYYFERLVEDLLFLSGVNDPRYGESFNEVDLSELVSEEGELFETDKVKVTYQIEEDLKVHGEHHLLRRLIKNSLSNAARFAKSELIISLSEEDEGMILKVTDDGPGLQEEELKQFGEKKFSRQFLDSNSDHISIGLGSVIMKKIISLHDGEMKVQNSHKTGGCELIFIFPK